MRNILVVLFLFSGFISFGQGFSTSSKKAIDLYMQADNYFVRRQYNQANSLLDQAIKKDKNFVEAYIKKGVVYKKQRQYLKARTSLEKANELSQKTRHFYGLDFELGELYVLLEEYDLAVRFLESYIDSNYAKGDKKKMAIQMLQNASFAKENEKMMAEFKPRPLSRVINQFPLQYFPIVTIDNQSIIYTRRMGHRSEHDEDLVVATKNESGEWQQPVSFSDDINSKINEGTCTLSADGRLIIFTSCFGRKGFGSCDLFFSVKHGDRWSKPRNMGANINSRHWESQPSLSADGNTLYYISDRPGGLGKTDIWVATKDLDGVWSKPKNMGASINSAKREYSPFIHANNSILYFASNGQPGFGGFDIYYSKKEGDAWGKPTNMGSPLNTGQDQLSLFITGDGEKGYYSHEAMGTTGATQSLIYEFDIPEQMKVGFKVNYVRGIVKDEKTKEPLGAQVVLYNVDKNEAIARVASDSITGEYLMVLPEGANYALYTNAVGYLFNSSNFNYKASAQLDPVYLDVLLGKAEKGVSIVLNNIFFDHDQFDLKEASKTELDKIVDFLSQNAGLKVEIIGHTDSVGDPAYNKRLSQKRAQAVVDHLIKNGISKNRLRSKGMGSDQPIEDNSTELGRSKNRRIEFSIQDF